MSELKPRHTPQGYRIDGQYKYFRIPSGSELSTESTECEMELWEIREGLIEALELAEIWLMQCIPIVEIDGPKPLPVIRAALAQAKGGE